MFSGIIEEFATVVAIQKDRDNIDFTLRCSFVDELSIDQSVAHNGVCLTVVRIENGTYVVTAMKETLERSNLGLLKVGDKVNIERSMLMNGRLDGHIVQGHVDETARCIAMEDANGSTYFTFEYREHLPSGYHPLHHGTYQLPGHPRRYCCQPGIRHHRQVYCTLTTVINNYLVKISIKRQILSMFCRFISINRQKTSILFFYFVDNIYLCIDKIRILL